MFFWNKYCGLALLFLNLNLCVSAQNPNCFRLVKSAFFFQNISQTRQNNGKMFLRDRWLSEKIDKSFLRSSSLSLSQFAHTKTPKYTAFPANRATAKLLAFKTLHSDAETSSNPMISADFSTCRYGFFCKQELKIEKAINLPLRVRLGSLQQCNYYEGKP